MRRGCRRQKNSRIFIGRQIAFDETVFRKQMKGTREGGGKRMSGHL
ncbi:MAG: hypothetical protein ACLRIL_11455 [Fusicatenibacter saccharivorans]